jgi:hypothetical protein
MNDYPLISQLKEASDYDKIFNLVKRTVEKTISRRRAGLSLVLTEIPNHIGAYFVEGGNNIYMNITILNAMKQLTTTKEEFNSFVYSILTHEYLHSLGYSEETTVRPLVKKICEEHFGPGHKTSTISSHELYSIYPKLRNLGPGRENNQNFKVIDNFDKSSMSYIG